MTQTEARDLLRDLDRLDVGVVTDGNGGLTLQRLKGKSAPVDLRDRITSNKQDLIALVLGRAFDNECARTLTLQDLCRLPAGKCVLVVRDADGKLGLRKPEDLLETFGKPVTLGHALEELCLTLVEVRERS